ncbi:MAG TPA: NAD-dependent epimerase/dehydratase family protein [Chloroflexota bacterium]
MNANGSWSNRNVLVTGGASFIGSHLVDRLVCSGARVRVADDLSSGRLENLNASHSKVDFRRGDLRDRDFTRDVLADQQVVFHLAACHGGRGFIDTHPADCASNLVLDGMVFDEACKAGVEKVAFASSACVYPTRLQEAPTDGTTVYLREEWADPFKDGAAGADGEYGWAKLMGEMSLRAYYKQHGLKSVACRLFTVYGERENESHAVIALIAKAFTCMDPYPIWGNGQQDRNFTYVGDIVEGMIRSAASDVNDGSAINIGTAEHVKIIDSARMIFDETGFLPEKIDFDLTRPVGVFSRAADLTRTRAYLDWEPETTFQDGLRRTIRWYYATHDRKRVAAQLTRLLTER